MLEIYTIAVLLLGSFHIGPLSLRVYATISMAIYLFLIKDRSKQSIPLKSVNILLIYILICFAIKLLSTYVFAEKGIDELTPFFNRCIANFLPAIIAYIAIDRLLDSEKKVKRILLTLIAIGSFNAFVTWLQSTGNVLGITLGQLFTTNENSSLDFINERLGTMDESFMLVPGIFGHAAVNGYLSATLGILPMFYVLNNKISYRLFGLVCLSICIIGCFFCQERSAFGLLTLFIVFCMINNKSKATNLLIIASIAFLFLLFSGSLFEMVSSGDAGRLSKIGELGDDRLQLFYDAFEFIPNHLFLGGDILYSLEYGLSPHNFFLHSFIYSGFIGAIVIIYLFAYFIKKAWSIMIALPSNTAPFIFSCSLTIYLLNGIFHSSSLITGDISIWLFAALMLKSEYLINNKLE